METDRTQAISMAACGAPPTTHLPPMITNVAEEVAISTFTTPTSAERIYVVLQPKWVELLVRGFLLCKHLVSEVAPQRKIRVASPQVCVVDDQ